MVFYIRASAEAEPKQFTTALEAKEYITANFQDAVSLAYQKDPPERVDDLDFFSYEDIEDAKDAVDDARSEMAGEEDLE